MKYRIKTITGTDISIELDEHKTVGDLLTEACNQLNKPVGKSLLIFASKKLTSLNEILANIGYTEDKHIIIHTIGTNKTEQNTSLSSENLGPENNEIKVDNEQKSKEQAENARKQEFAQALENITSMGFSADHAEAALRLADGNQNAALNIILHRRSSQPRLNERRIEEQRIRTARRRNAKKIRLSPLTPHRQKHHVYEIPGFNITKNREFEKPISNLFCEFIKNNEQTMERLNTVIQEESLEFLDSIQQNPTPMVTMLGLIVQSNEFSGIQTSPYSEVFTEPLISAFDLTPDEIPVIERLLHIGAPLTVTVRAYRTSNNNEALTRQFLRSRYI